MNKTKAYTLEEAKLCIARYCVYRDRSHKEVISKLKEMRMIPEAIDQIVTYLIEEDFLNEERYAQSFARGKFNIKNWGRKKIVHHLNGQDISAYCIKKALLEIDDKDYIQKLYTLSERKLESLHSLEKNAKKKKLVDYLLYRGWENHLVYEIADELIH